MVIIHDIYNTIWSNRNLGEIYFDADNGDGIDWKSGNKNNKNDKKAIEIIVKSFADAILIKNGTQYFLMIMHKVRVCCALLWLSDEAFRSYTSQLLDLHWGNHDYAIISVPVRQPWRKLITQIPKSWLERSGNEKTTLPHTTHSTLFPPFHPTLPHPEWL